MPLVTGIARRGGVYTFRIGTTGTGAPSTLWPPIDSIVPVAGTPISYGPVSKNRARVVRGPFVDTSAAERLSPGTPVTYFGPVSRNRPRFVSPPSNSVVSGPVVDIYSLPNQVLQGQDAVFVFASEDQAQQDIWDIGEPAEFVAQESSLPDNEQVDLLANWQPNPDFLDSGSASFIAGGGVVAGAGEIGGSGVLQSGSALFVVPENAYQDNRAGGQLNAQSAEFVTAIGVVATPPFGAQEIANALLNATVPGTTYTVGAALRVLMSEAAGVTSGNPEAAGGFGFLDPGADPETGELVLSGEIDAKGRRTVTTIHVT